MRVLVGLLLAGCVHPPPPSAVSGPVTVAMGKIATGQRMVPIEVEGHAPLSFVLDTGAGITAITPATAVLLGAPTGGKHVSAIAVGGRVDIRIVTLPSLQIAGHQITDLQVAVVDLSGPQSHVEDPIDGVLGRDFLERTDLVVDFTYNNLTLLPRGAIALGNGPSLERFSSATKFHLVGGSMRVPVGLGTLDGLEAGLDLGADHSVVNHSTALSAGGHVFVHDNGAMLGADGHPVPVIGGVAFDGLRIGDASLAAPEFGVCEDIPCASLLVGGEKAHLGVDVLRGHTLLLSYADSMLWVSR